MLSNNTHIQKYVTESVLGQGAFGVVYKVYSTENRKKYAMKAADSHSSEAVKKAISYEASIYKCLNTIKRDPDSFPVLQMIEYFKIGTCAYLIFPLMSVNLCDYLKSNGNLPLPKEHIQNISLQLFKALEFIQSLGIVHRDIKSDNILLRDDSHYFKPYAAMGRSSSKVLRDTRVVLGDFGIAKVIKGEKQEKGYISPFLAPEICINYPWDYGVDVYAVGLVMQEMRGGEPLIPGNLNAVTTLILLDTVMGPLPEKLVNHVKTLGNLPLCAYRKKASLFSRGTGGIGRWWLDIEMMLDPGKVDLKKLPTWAAWAQESRNLLSGDKILKDFEDLVWKKILVYDPDVRITVGKALKHAYFKK